MVKKVSTVVIKLNPLRLQPHKIKRAAGVLRSGGLVAFPTETVYGLAANFLNRKAMARLQRVKRRPKGKPFTVHIASADDLKALKCRISPTARRLMDRFWPGPLTLIMKNSRGKRIGVRMPANRIAICLLKECGVPVVAPSANLSGRRPPVTAKDVLRDLNGAIEMVLDGGRTEVGIESTVVDTAVSPAKILREGAVGKEVRGVLSVA